MPAISQNRTADTFPYHTEILKPQGTLDLVIDWCKSECQHDWRWRMVESSSILDPGKYQFYFDSDRDACAFTLRWR